MGCKMSSTATITLRLPTYIGPFQYRATSPLTGAGDGDLIDTLQFFAHPEGRVRVENDTVGGSTSGPVIGPGIVLKVMAGDQFSIRVGSWYQLNGTTPGAPVNPLTDLLTHLISGMALKLAFPELVERTGCKCSKVQAPKNGCFHGGIIRVRSLYCRIHDR
jgi:hypothetical protein